MVGRFDVQLFSDVIRLGSDFRRMKKKCRYCSVCCFLRIHACFDELSSNFFLRPLKYSLSLFSSVGFKNVNPKRTPVKNNIGTTDFPFSLLDLVVECDDIFSDERGDDEEN